MIVGASLYGFSEYMRLRSIIFTSLTNQPQSANATEEFFVRRSPLYEVVGQLGMWGTLINGIQMSGLEHNGMRTANWSGENSTCRPVLAFASSHTELLLLVGLLAAYTAAMVILYTVAPILYRLASSAYYNLSLLSSDFYGLLFGLFLFVRLISITFNELEAQLLFLSTQRVNSTTSHTGSTSPHSQ